MYKFETIKFKNGLRVLLVPSENTSACRVMILVKAGSLYEPKDINGISHFMEHMCFKGTQRRPNSYKIVSELDGVGASYNAVTHYEYTGYYATVDSGNLSLALDIISDIYLNSVYPENELGREKDVIIEEINMYQDNPQSYIWDLWTDLLYGDQAAGREIAGTKETVRKLTRQNLIDYRDKLYRSGSTLLVISGNFKKDAALSEIKKRLANIKEGEGYSQYSTKEKQDSPAVLLKYKKTDQTHLVLGVRAFDYFNKGRYGLSVLNAILDGGMSGMLWQLIREKLGVAYYISSGAEAFKDYGFWSIASGINNNKVPEVLPILLKEFKSLRDKNTNLEKLKTAKKNITGRVALHTDNVHDYARVLALDWLLKGEIETPSQYVKAINKVSLSDIKAIARKLIIPKNLNLTLIGPYKDEKLFKNILKSF